MGLGPFLTITMTFAALMVSNGSANVIPWTRVLELGNELCDIPDSLGDDRDGQLRVFPNKRPRAAQLAV